MGNLIDDFEWQVLTNQSRARKTKPPQPSTLSPVGQTSVCQASKNTFRHALENTDLSKILFYVPIAIAVRPRRPGPASVARRLLHAEFRKLLCHALEQLPPLAESQPA